MNKNTGFTLIEVLIAMIVLAVGLLGLAGLQATSLRNNQSAYNRIKATQLAYDIADRMRANYTEAKKSKGDNVYLDTPPRQLEQYQIARIPQAVIQQTWPSMIFLNGTRLLILQQINGWAI